MARNISVRPETFVETVSSIADVSYTAKYEVTGELETTCKAMLARVEVQEQLFEQEKIERPTGVKTG